MIKLGYTSQATPKECEDGRLLHPINVCNGGTAATITAHEGGRCLANILSLAHYPITAVLVQYGETIKF